jgi:hypothetical protein
LFLAETRAWEVTSVDESHDVDDDLVFVKNCVYDDGDDGGEVRFATYFDEYYDETSCLEYSAVVMLV